MKKVSKQREYATMLRAQHSTMKKQHQSRGPAPLGAKPQRVKEAELKRQTVSKLYMNWTLINYKLQGLDMVCLCLLFVMRSSWKTTENQFTLEWFLKHF